MKQKYEYWLIRSDDLQKHEDAINKKAKEGWEAVNISYTSCLFSGKGILGEDEGNGTREFLYGIRNLDSLINLYVTLMKREK